MVIAESWHVSLSRFHDRKLTEHRDATHDIRVILLHQHMYAWRYPSRRRLSSYLFHNGQIGGASQRLLLTRRRGSRLAMPSALRFNAEWIQKGQLSCCIFLNSVPRTPEGGSCISSSVPAVIKRFMPGIERSRMVLWFRPKIGGF